MNPVALAAGQLADLLLLVGALEVEGGDIGAARHLALAELDLVAAVGDLLPHGLVGLERFARLVDVAEPYRRADAEAAAIGLLLLGDDAGQRGLAGAVGSDHSDDAARRQAEAEVVDQQAIAIALPQMLALDYQVAQPRPGRDDDLGRFGRLLAGLGEQRLVGGDARLALGLAGARRLAEPFQLVLPGPLAGALLLLLERQPLLLLLQPGGVVPVPRNPLCV